MWSDLASDLATVAGTSPGSVLVSVILRLQFQLLASYRIARFFHGVRVGGSAAWVLIRYWQHVVAGCQIAPTAVIGRGVRFPHPLGIVIGEHVVVEDGVTIFQQVTLGSHGAGDAARAYPTVREGATLYAGAKVVGAVVVGAHAVVGANAVVTRDVPDGHIAVGVPARTRPGRAPSAAE